ncbi:MAG: DinB family protein [Pseudomonadota bacterium]
MITTRLVQTLADYNQWQNASVYAAADALTDADRTFDRGAFWGSIEGTLNHILWGDRLWLSRLGDGEPPNSQSMPDTTKEGGEWRALKRARAEQDAAISAWAASVEQSHLDSYFTYVSAAIGKEFTQNVGLLTIHMFNHQTHHRGQVHAMLTNAGTTPEDTDLPFMPGLSPG